jgi:pimeloyl-ACP methyl ester carboxylesterase
MKNKSKNKNNRFLLGLGLGLPIGWLAYELAWVWSRLKKINVHQTLSRHANRGPRGLQEIETYKTDVYTMTHTIEDGIERIVYTPTRRRFETPILMQHGMWHGAWCWWLWQELFAEWGWESHSFSLPGHSYSPEQRPIRLCTLDYYLGFLKAEIERLPRRPVLMGHSMGGALTQWYFKHIGDDLPAAVLVAPWVSHSTLVEGLPRFLMLDPIGCSMVSLDWSSTPFIRTPERTARALISNRAVISPDELFARLTPESALILFQHNPPLWYPADHVNTPLLWLAGEYDTLISVEAERRSAAHYKADFMFIDSAGHNLMMEHNFKETAQSIHNWLIQQNIP